MNVLRRIIYTSKATLPLDQRALLNILHGARDCNNIDGITGVLLHDDGCFLQVIEGPQEPIANLIERLKKDTRHDQFQIHEDVQTQTRLFPDWKMGFGDLSDPTLAFLPGMAISSEHYNRLFFMVGRIPELAEQLNLALVK
ncbi:MAG: hypothetical protein ACI8P2_003785 [Candidatus Latescibacterota bacterium]|jgi:hypothetical protein